MRFFRRFATCQAEGERVDDVVMVRQRAWRRVVVVRRPIPGAQLVCLGKPAHVVEFDGGQH